MMIVNMLEGKVCRVNGEVNEVGGWRVGRKQSIRSKDDERQKFRVTPSMWMEGEKWCQ